MMSGRDKVLLALAAALSLLLHAGVGYAVMNLRIDTASRFPLFQETREQADRPMRVHRSSEDLIVDRQPESSAGATGPASPGEDASAERERISRKLLDSLDPSKLMPPDPAPEPEAEVPRPEFAGPPDVPEPQAGGTEPLDASQALLRHAEPSVSLPEYVGPTDEVKTPASEGQASLNPADRIDPRDLDKLDPLMDEPVDPIALGSAGSDGSGTGSGSRGSAGAGSGTGGGPIGAPSRSPLASYRPTIRNSGTGSGNAGDASDGDGARVTGPERPSLAAGSPAELDLPELPTELTSLQPAEQGGEEGDGEPREVAHLDDDFTYSLRLLPEFDRNKGLLGLFAGDSEEGGPGYFEVEITPKRSLRRLKPLKKDVVWVIDTSSSVTDKWVKRVRNGVSMALDSLNEGDRFNIVTFKDTVRVFSEGELADASPRQRSEAREFLDSAEASGYTDVNRALSELIVRHVPDDRVYQIVLISDGRPTRGAIDPRQIINIITQENDLVAGIFCVGIGDQRNRELLEYLAHRNKGTVVYPENRFQTAATIRKLAGRLRHPVVKNASFSAAGVNAGRIYPRIPRDIYQGQPVRLYGRYVPGESRRLSMRLSGINDQKRMDLTFTLRFDNAARGDKQVARDWALHRLHHLYSRLIGEGENKKLRKQIERLQREYNLEAID